VAKKGGGRGMSIRILENPMNTPLAEGIPGENLSVSRRKTSDFNFKN